VTTREACTVCGSLAGVFPPCDCFGYNPCDHKGKECLSLSVFHHVVVLVTTPDACTVCGSLAGVFPPCDCFGYNPRDHKGEECLSLSVFHHVVVLVTTPDACTVCVSLAGVFPSEIVLVTTHVIRSAQYVFL